MHNLQEIVCPIQRAATLVADVTVIIILRELHAGPRRFGELQAAGVNPRSLSERLRRLTEEGDHYPDPLCRSPPACRIPIDSQGARIVAGTHGSPRLWRNMAAAEVGRIRVLIREPLGLCGTRNCAGNCEPGGRK